MRGGSKSASRLVGCKRKINGIYKNYIKNRATSAFEPDACRSVFYVARFSELLRSIILRS